MCGTLQLSYAIGVAEPLSIFVSSYGTGVKTDAELLEIVKANFDLRPGKIVKWVIADMLLTPPFVVLCIITWLFFGCHTSAIDCLERLIPGMTCCMLSGMLNSTQSHMMPLTVTVQFSYRVDSLREKNQNFDSVYRRYILCADLAAIVDGDIIGRSVLFLFTL